MKNYKWLAVLVAALSWNATAAVINSSWNVNQIIPDADPSGYVNNQKISGTGGGVIGSVLGVNLNLSGGWNGDLYGYLRYDSGNGVGFVELLNRVGASGTTPQGFTTAGMNVWLSDAVGLGNIHNVKQPLDNGQYQVDQTASGNSLVSFQGLDPTTGTWSLFLADMSGNHQSTLLGWSLNLSMVPEPTTWALIIFGGLLGAVKVGQYCRRVLRKPGAVPHE